MDPTMEALYESGAFNVFDALSDMDADGGILAGEFFESSLTAPPEQSNQPIQCVFPVEDGRCERRQRLEGLFERPQWQGLPDREQGEAYLLQQYRRNRSSSTIRGGYRMIVRFSDFLALKGKSPRWRLNSGPISERWAGGNGPSRKRCP